jgi:PRC-barrel domain
MSEVTHAYGFRGRTLIDRDGDRIGKIDDVYEDHRGGQAEWALVSTGLFGTKKTFVPLRDAHPIGEDLRVPVARNRVKDAPHIDADTELGEREERQLFEHYDVAYTAEGRDASGPTADDAMTRSEAGPVRLRKYVARS